MRKLFTFEDDANDDEADDQETHSVECTRNQRGNCRIRLDPVDVGPVPGNTATLDRYGAAGAQQEQDTRR